MSHSWRAALQDAALVIASSSVVLLGLEGALRVAGFEPGGESAVRRMVGPRGTPLLDCFPSNPRGYFEIDLRDPAKDALYRGLAPHRFDAIARDHRWAVEVRYNALGFRDVPPAPRPHGVRRVVVLGDSFAEGQGVKEADTLARVLERLLETRAAGRYQVRNCGRRGMDFPELLGSFEDALAYEPDLVIYTLTLNDAVQPPEFHERQSFVNDWILDRTREPDAPQARPSPFRPRVFDFVAERWSALLIGRQTTRFYLDMWSDANRGGFERTQEYLREMKRRLDERGARLLIAPWPLFVGLEQDYPFAPVHDSIHRFCLVAQIPYHDLLKTFEGRPAAELWVHPVDHHPNEIAHRVAAEALLPLVLKLAEP
jgi:lysophospholipase L1-like esterase